jgi:hypothetical protein
MRTLRMAFLPALALVLLLVAFPAQALSNRVFVSTTGNDANDCSNPLTPCVDFSGALAQVAAGGEIIAQATGPYGPLNITKAVTISGPSGVVIYSGHQVTVNASGAVVVLRGLTIDGNGAVESGINVVAVGTLFVESCVIANFSGSGNNGNGILFNSTGNLFVKDTTSRQNAFGVVIFGGRASIDHCRFEHNLHSGVLVDGADATVRGSVSAGNGFNGFEATANAAENTILNVYECISTNNGNDGFGVHNSGTGFLFARVANSAISENFGHGLDNFTPAAVTFESLGNSLVRGNLGGEVSAGITVVAGQ